MSTTQIEMNDGSTLEITVIDGTLSFAHHKYAPQNGKTETVGFYPVLKGAQ